MNKRKSPSSLASIIPQVFYDFIARIIPGSILIISFSLPFINIFNDKLLVMINEIPLSIIILVWLVVSYTIGILFWQLHF